MSTLKSLKQTMKKISRLILPLSFRKKLTIWLNGQEWIDKNRRNWWCTEILKDLAENDINEYHRFLWANHLAYAETYEPVTRFGVENIKESRKIFFRDLLKVMREHGIDSSVQVRSIFEVGCSLGYQLRYMETDLFPGAGVLMGNDIDKYAIETGTEYLRRNKSKIELFQLDMEELDERLEGYSFDLILSTGVLMYLQEDVATRVVQTMMDHTGNILAVAGLAHPEKDNVMLEQSVSRERDGSFIHNIDRMIQRAGGNIISRRWEGDTDVDGNTIYFVFATPPSSQIDNHISK